jgi:hypothetical protein
MDVLRRCDCADKPNDTAQAVMLDMLVSRFCKALGEPIPEDAIRRAEQLAGAVGERARWTRAFNRLEKAVTNHIANCIDADDLAHAHRAVMRDLGPGGQ